MADNLKQKIFRILEDEDKRVWVDIIIGGTIILAAVAGAQYIRSCNRVDYDVPAATTQAEKPTTNYQK